MKRFLLVINSLLLVLIGTYTPVWGMGDISVLIDGTQVEFDVQPQIIDNRIMVPIRSVFEALGADVEWKEESQTAVSTRENVQVEMTLNSQDLYINGQKTQMDTSPLIISGRVLAPIRYAAEAFGGKVQWNDAEQRVTIFVNNLPEQNKVTLYAEDGRTLDVFESEVPEYLNVGWYRTLEETQQMLYAADGRTITVYKAEVPDYLNVGWYRTLEETQQTLYAADGRTITVYRTEVPSYKDVGWYESQTEANEINRKNKSVESTKEYNPEPDGAYYRTPTGKRYHLDPNCGGKNSYRTTNINGLTPCQKCAQ